MTQPSKPLDDPSQPIDKLRLGIWNTLVAYGRAELVPLEGPMLEEILKLVEAEIVEREYQLARAYFRRLEKHGQGHANVFMKSFTLKSEALKQPNQDKEV